MQGRPQREGADSYPGRSPRADNGSGGGGVQVGPELKFLRGLGISIAMGLLRWALEELEERSGLLPIMEKTYCVSGRRASFMYGKVRSREE